MTNEHERPPLIVGLGGTTRPNSSSDKALACSLRAAEAMGARTLCFSGPQLDLPMYRGETRERSAAARQLVDALRRCDGVIIASPSYHGSISGMVKNALDYTEDLKDPERVYFDGLPVGLIACASGWQGAVQTLATLRSIVHSLRGWPTPLGAALNTSSPMFDEAGACLEAAARFQLESVGRQVMEFVSMKRALAQHLVLATEF